MHHVFDVEDSSALNTIVWTELKKQGIKETGRCRKPTRNNNNNDSQKRTLFGQPLELLESDQALVMVEAELNERTMDGSAFVHVKGDILVRIPTFVLQACQAILKGVETEGLFRKAGSASRQRDIKRQLEKGEGVKPVHDVIDLANILKQFLRELPEPLIPYQLHEMLLKCIQLENPDKVFRTIHLVCLLIPQRALATLCYLLQFFEAVAAKSTRNLMDAGNLSIVIAPTLFPVHIAPSSSRSDRQKCTKVQLSARVIQIMIENGSKLCGLPQCISARLVSISTTSLTVDPGELRGRRSSRCDKKRHRRSSSFNRVFEGLRKIVGVRAEWASTEQLSDVPSESMITTTLIEAPIAPPIPPPLPEPASSSPNPARRTSLKRKVLDSDFTGSNLGLSMKKKKATGALPNGGKVMCTTPLTPQGNHRYAAQQSEVHRSYFASPRIDLNPSPSGHLGQTESNRSAAGVLRFFHRKKGGGRNEEANAAGTTGTTAVKTPSKFTRRRLSLAKKSTKKLVVDPNTKWGESDQEAPKTLINSPPNVPVTESQQELMIGAGGSIATEEETYDAVRVQYDQIKRHVIALEKEVGPISPDDKDPFDRTLTARMSLPLQVQGQYEKTLEESEKLILERSASEQLARQLSRGLRIRRSAEQRVLRSPSARKIGAVRRRSRESSPRQSLLDSNASSGSSRRLTRSQSMLAIRRNPAQVLRVFQQQQQQLQVMLTPKRLLTESPFRQQQQPDSAVKVSLRRGQPNTIRTGLRDPTPMRVPHSSGRSSRNSPATSAGVVLETPRAGKPRVLAYPSEQQREGEARPSPSSGKESTRTPPTRIPSATKRTVNRNGSVMKLAQNFTSTVQIKEAKPLLVPPPATPPVGISPGGVTRQTSEQIQWTSGEVVLNNRHLDHLRIPLTGRPSVQKIRSENLGKVSAHVRKFDRMASPTAPAKSETDATDEACMVQPPEETPHRRYSVTPATVGHRRLSSAPTYPGDVAVVKTPTQVSPLRESQKTNALPLSNVRTTTRDHRQDVKIKAPLLTPSADAATPFGLKLRGGLEASVGRHHARMQKKPSPMRAHPAVATGLRRSPRFVGTPH